MSTQLQATRSQEDSAYRAIFEASSDGLVINDAETGVVLEANPAFCQMHGYDQMAGLHPTTFIHPTSHHLFDEYLRTVRHGMEFRARAQDVRRDGTVFDVEVLGRGFVYQGRFALLGVVRDVTEQVRAYQDLEQRVAARTREIERRRAVAEGLRDLLATINSARTLDEILAAVLAQAGRLLGSHASAIYVPAPNEGGQFLRVAASTGLDAEYVAAGAAVGVPVTGLAFARRRPVAVYDVGSALSHEPDDALDPQLEDRTSHLSATRVRCEVGERSGEGGPGAFAGHRAILAVPLAARAVISGCLTLLYREPRQFSHDEVWLATAFADQAALAIENARLHAQLEQRLHEQEALYHADQQMHRSLHLEVVLQALADVAMDILGADSTSVLVWDETGDRLVLGASRGLSPEQMARMTFAPGEGIIGRVALTGQPRVVEDALAEVEAVPRFGGPGGVRAGMHVPIILAQHVFGVFAVGYVTPRRFSADEQRLLLSLAQRAALAIQNARLYQQAQQAATLEERQRLARELHDAVTQTLFSTALIAEVLPELWAVDPDAGRQQLAELRRLTRGALAEMRTLLVELRPGALTELPLGDLLRLLAEATAGRTRLEVSARVEGQVRPLPAAVQVALYRLAQEALNNVVKHAQAHWATLELAYHPGGVRLQVADDGCGFDPAMVPAVHLGVGIMRERADAIGAHFQLTSQPGRGTTIDIHWQKTEESAP